MGDCAGSALRKLTASLAVTILAVGVGATSRPLPAAAAGSMPASTAAPLLLQSWPGTTQSTQVQELSPADETVTPPDPQIAVGGSWVVESTNAALFVYQRDGAPAPDRPGAICPAPGPTWLSYVQYSLGGCNQIDLNNFVASTGWQIADPSVAYDPEAEQFYLTLSLTTTPPANQSCAAGSPDGSTCSVVLVLHTTTGDPTGQWSATTFRPFYYGVTAARPRLGFSADKVAVAWDEETSKHLWVGDSSLVMSKALFLAGAFHPVILPASGTPAPPETAHFGLTPVTDLGAGSTLYMVANDGASDLVPGQTAALFVDALTGAAAGSVQQTDTELPLSDGYSVSPPAAPQAGSGNLIATGDDRIAAATWSDGLLWTGFDETCTPAQDTAARACIRYLEVATSPMQVTAEMTLAIPGTYAYYPSFGIDPAGDLFSTFAASSSTADPSVFAVGVPAGQTSLSDPVTIMSGAGPYQSAQPPAAGCNPITGQCVFGDVTGGAMDPMHPYDFWFAGEVQLDTANAADWGTAVGRLSYAAPSIANLTPAAGPVGGGTLVTVSGSDFGPGTTLSFAGQAVTLTSLSPDALTFVTPAGSPGSVSAIATDGLGSSRPAPYLYVAPSSYTPVAPYRVLDTRLATCVQCGGGALGPGETRNLPVAGYVPSGYSGQTVPAGATAVVLNVTAVLGTKPTFLTVFPAGGGVPVASNLNPAPGQIIPNLVVVAVGSSGEISIYNDQGSIDVVADVEGYFTSGSGSTSSTPGPAGLFHAQSPPVRVCDTRGGQGTPCIPAVDAPFGPGQARLVAVTGGATGVATGGDAEAAILNLTAVSGTSATYLTVYPPTLIGAFPVCGAAPLASNVNVPAGINQPNRVITPVVDYQGTGFVCVFNDLGKINVVVDVNGWFGNGDDTGGSLFYALGPSRICDTRYTQGTQCAGETLAPGEALPVQIVSTPPLPASVTALVANVTGVSGTQATYLTLYPEAMYPPGTSDLNPYAGATIANLAVVAVAPDGRVDIYNSQGAIDVVVDAVGWFG